MRFKGIICLVVLLTTLTCWSTISLKCGPTIVYDTDSLEKYGVSRCDSIDSSFTYFEPSVKPNSSFFVYDTVPSKITIIQHGSEQTQYDFKGIFFKNETVVNSVSIDSAKIIDFDLNDVTINKINTNSIKLKNLILIGVSCNKMKLYKAAVETFFSNSSAFYEAFILSNTEIKFLSMEYDTFQSRILVIGSKINSKNSHFQTIRLLCCNFYEHAFFIKNQIYTDFELTGCHFYEGFSFQNDSLFGKIIMNDCTINNGSADFYSINYMKEDGPYFEFANNSYEKIKIPFKKLADKSSSYVIDFDSSLSWNQIESEYAQIINSLKEQGLWSDHDAALLEYKSRQGTHYLSDHKYVKWIISNFINITSQYGTNYFRALTSVMFVIIIFGLGYFVQSMNYHREKPNWWFWSYKKPGILSLLFSSYLYSIAVLFGHYPSRLLGIKKRKLCPLAVAELAIGYILISIFLVTLFNVTTR